MAEKTETKSGDKRLVLIAIDASEQAQHAFDWYLENCHSDANELLLVHIADPPFVSTQQVMYMSGDLWTQMLEAEKTKVRQLELKFADQMRAKGVPGRIKALFHGRPGEAIVELAKEEKCQFIVMGTRGLGAVRRTILGSVSDYVLHHVSGRIKGVFHNRPGEAIAETAKEEHASLIIVGTRGLGTVRRTVLGSVSDYMLHHAHCPVAIVRQPPDHQTHKPSEKVLVYF